MKNITLLLFFSCALGTIHSALSQAPLVKIWDARFGGLEDDELYSFQQTDDGGYILAGWSSSDIGGDKTQDLWGNLDYWIVKIDSLGNKQWDKDFGGTDSDYLRSIVQTSDGGYILGGWSASGIGGDKTENSRGGDDYWIVKIDSLGNKQWDKSFGGTDNDRLWSLQHTSDGGYILSGTSMSNSGGDKTQNSWGSWDFWIVKTDALGTIQWDRDIGGTLMESLGFIRQTTDGGYILGGSSLSGIGGNKTQDVWGNASDYWIIKINPLGNIQWDKDFGGTNAEGLLTLLQSADGGYIVGGHSYSNISGDKTQDIWGYYDYWVVKTDSLGNKQWDKDYGGTQADLLLSAQQTTDGGYLFGGTSSSDISGNKTENNLGTQQSWIVKTNSLGDKLWDKTIFTTGSEEQGYSIQTRDGCYAIANWTDAGIGGYKTQENWDTFTYSYDYWIVKFCDSTIINGISEKFYEDEALTIYPNPVSETLYIKGYTGHGGQAITLTNEISVYNLLGEKIPLAATCCPWTVDCRPLPPGLYYLELTADEKIFRSKFVKQ